MKVLAARKTTCWSCTSDGSAQHSGAIWLMGSGWPSDRDGIALGKDPALPSHPGRVPRTCSHLFFRGLPERNWSAALNAKLPEIARTKTAMWDADVSDLRETPADEIWLVEHRGSLGDRPVRIITTDNDGMTDWT